MNRQTEQLDKTITSSMLKAERLCERRARHEAWSPQLIRRCLTLKYWQVKLEGIRNARDPTTILQHISEKYQDIDDDPEDDSLERAKGKLSEEAYQQVKEAKEQAKGLPEQYLQELVEIMALQNNETAEQVLLD